MIRYLYNRQCNPPAPFIHVTLRALDAPEEYVELPAQLDAAADRSVIPWRVVELLHLPQIDEIAVAGSGGPVARLPAFAVQVQPRGLHPVDAKSVASPDEPYVLLGRDVLNHYRLFLYGPELALEIG